MKYTDRLHPRDRMGKWIKTLDALKPGEGVRAPLRGVGVFREEDGGFRVSGVGDYGMPVHYPSAETAARRSMGGQLSPEAEEKFDGTLFDRDTLQALVEGFNAKSETHFASTTRIEYSDEDNPRMVAVAGIIATRDPQSIVGTFDRKYHLMADGRFMAEHSTLMVGDNSGAGTGFSRHLEEEYAKLNVAKIRLSAAMSAGGYVWAREGYRFKRYDAARDFDSYMQHTQESMDRSNARSLFQARFDDWADVAGESVEDGLYSWEDVREFANRFAAIHMPEDYTFSWEEPSEWMPGEVLDDEDPDDESNIWYTEVMRGEGGTFFTSPAEIAMWGIEDAWDQDVPGGQGTRRMWLGKQFLLGATWEGEKTIYPDGADEVQEAVADDLERVVTAVRDELGDDVDDETFWLEVRARWFGLRETIMQTYSEQLHPRGRGGRWVRSGLSVTGVDLVDMGIPASAHIDTILDDLERQTGANPDLNRPGWLLQQARARALRMGLMDGYAHKDDQDSFWERMEDLGHRRPAHLREARLEEASQTVKVKFFDMHLHPRDRTGKFIETLNAIPKPKRIGGGPLGVVDVDQTPYDVARTRKGFTVVNTEKNTTRDFDTAEEAAEHVATEIRSRQLHEEIAKELEDARTERLASQQEREARLEAAQQEEERKATAEYDKRFPRDEKGRRYCYRVDTDPAALQRMIDSGELHGKPKTNFLQGLRPVAQAYMGRMPTDLPEGEYAIEFVTDVPPNRGLAPGKAEWSTGGKPGESDYREGDHPDLVEGPNDDGEHRAKLKIHITNQSLPS